MTGSVFEFSNFGPSRPFHNIEKNEEKNSQIPRTPTVKWRPEREDSSKPFREIGYLITP